MMGSEARPGAVVPADWGNGKSARFRMEKRHSTCDLMP